MTEPTDRAPQNTAGRTGPTRAEAEKAVETEDLRAQASGSRMASADGRRDRRSPMALAIGAVVLLAIVAVIAWIF